jgi:hypothetical protein
MVLANKAFNGFMPPKIKLIFYVAWYKKKRICRVNIEMQTIVTHCSTCDTTVQVYLALAISFISRQLS